MRHPQTHISPTELQKRRRIAQLYVEMTLVMHSMAFPSKPELAAGDVETMLVWSCVFLADMEGRAASVSKIAAHAQMPRATVYRKLEYLLNIGKIEREGHSYCYARDAVNIDRQGRLTKVVEQFCSQMSESDNFKVAI